MRRAWTIVALALACLPARAQPTGVELRLESQTLEVGETISAQIVCTNTGRPKPPDLTAPTGLTMQFVSSTPSVSSMTSIINGQRSSRETYVYSLRLSGDVAGTYTLGPLRIEVDGASYQTQPVRIVVRDSATAGLPVGDKLAFVRIELNRSSLYVTESFEAALTIGIRRIYIEGQLLNYDRLLRSVDANASALAGFGPQFTAGEVTLTDSSGVAHEYILYRDHKTIRAEQVGTLHVGPVFLKIDYPTAFRRSFWGRGLEPSRTRRVTARAEAIPVEVKGPPLKGRPNVFTGAIGSYALSAAARPERVAQGQPVTLTITIRGTPVDGVAGPDLTQQPELMSRFEFATDELRGDAERGDTKVFRRAVFPRQEGQQTIPPIRWSYFDPQTEEYVTLATDTITITVDPPPEGSGDVPRTPLVSAADNNAAGGLTVLQGGLLPNVVEPRRVLANQAVPFLPAQVAALLAAPPALYLAITLAVRQRRRIRGDRRYARRRQARARARATIARAAGVPNAVERLAQLAHALSTMIADVFDLPPGEVTPGDVETVLSANAVDEQFAQQIVGFLRTADAIRYAPASANSTEVDDATDNVRRWIDRIDRSVK